MRALLPPSDAPCQAHIIGAEPTTTQLGVLLMLRQLTGKQDGWLLLASTLIQAADQAQNELIASCGVRVQLQC